LRLASIYLDEKEMAAVILDKKIITMEILNNIFNMNWPLTIQNIIKTEKLQEIKNWFYKYGKDKLENIKSELFLNEDRVRYAPLYRSPEKIWGIGLNYVEHASDLSEKAPDTEPASFMKPSTAIIGNGDNIKIPLQSQKTTAEAELGIIIGKKCRNIKRKDWLSVVAGFTTILDMTAEDILRRNPRYLTRSKSFNTFFSFGPQLVTPEEISNINSLKVSTVINNEIYGSNTVSNMTFPPDYLVSFHSEVMTLLPGDIISTGTPRAVHINDGDVVECRIERFKTLVNTVIDLKKRDH
jgi:2-keto-4-pentenoate hydratase/2-oxohepta-3-ene-1,7-dioic acid hydratase in catechol pathway